MAVVYGMPSAVMSKEISEKESERESQQAKDLGIIRGLLKISVPSHFS